MSEVQLYNADYIEKHHIGPGAKVHVIRSGDVIPKIEEFITSGTYLGIPEICPVCEQALTRVGADVKCTNAKCKGIFTSFLQYVVSKDVLDIKGVGNVVVKEIVDAGIASCFLDLFTPLETNTKQVSQEILDKIVIRMRRINLMELLMILGIGGMGRAIAGKLTTEVNDLTGLIETLESPELLRLLPINETVKTNLAAWYEIDDNKQILYHLRDMHLPHCD